MGITSNLALLEVIVLTRIGLVMRSVAVRIESVDQGVCYARPHRSVLKTAFPRNALGARVPNAPDGIPNAL